MTRECALKIRVHDQRKVTPSHIVMLDAAKQVFHVLPFVMEDLGERFAGMNGDHVTLLQPHVVPGEFEWLQSQCIGVGP